MNLNAPLVLLFKSNEVKTDFYSFMTFLNLRKNNKEIKPKYQLIGPNYGIREPNSKQKIAPKLTTSKGRVSLR